MLDFILIYYYDYRCSKWELFNLLVYYRDCKREKWIKIEFYIYIGLIRLGEERVFYKY